MTGVRSPGNACGLLKTAAVYRNESFPDADGRDNRRVIARLLDDIHPDSAVETLTVKSAGATVLALS